MFIILGGTGHVGSAVVRALLELGQQVTAIAGHPGSGGDLADLGARIEVADLNDIDHLRRIFQTGRRAFLLNPPGDIAGDPSQDERRSAFSIVSTLEGSGLEKVVMDPESIGVRITAARNATVAARSRKHSQRSASR